MPLHDLLRILFVASGCAALIYEIVWFHLLRLVIGASALSVGIVLASFMGGMFLGSLLFARYVPRHKDPMRVYALLEIGIGVFGLLMPILLPAVRFVYIGLVGYGPLGIAMRGADRGVPAAAADGAHGRDAAGDRAALSRTAAAACRRWAGSTPPTPSARSLGCLLSAFVSAGLVRRLGRDVDRRRAELR